MLKNLLLITVLLSGCAVRSIPPNVATVEGIQARTGTKPAAVSLEQPINSDDAVAIALQNNAQLKADLGALGIAEADLLEAGLYRNPKLDVLVPIGAKPFELLLSMPLEIFWQRSRRIIASQADLDRLAQSLIQNGLNVARDARLAYSELLQMEDRAKLAKESLELRAGIQELTEARLRAGDISELETIGARTDAAGAREFLARSEADAVSAMEKLRFILGQSIARVRLQVKASPVTDADPPAIETLVEKAAASRPELRAAELTIAAATQKGKWERSRLMLLSGLLSSKEVGTNGVLVGPGISVELPIFHRNQGMIKRADAEVAAASLQYLALKQRVAFEVADARNQQAQANDALKRLREDLKPTLERAVALAREQYNRGDVSYLYVLEQTRPLADARMREIDAEAAVRRAAAQLERSVGSR